MGCHWPVAGEEKAVERRAAGGRRYVEDPVGVWTPFAYDVDNPLGQVEEAAGAVMTGTYDALRQWAERDVASMPLKVPRGAWWPSRLLEVEFGPLVRTGEDGESAD